MKLNLYPQLIFRTPKFSLEKSLEDCWDELKTCISESSLEFFSLIKDVKANEIYTLPDNIQFTIWKYFNRSKHRSTPFGTFAAVAICPVAPVDKNSIVHINADLEVHRFVDWKNKSQIEFDFEDILRHNASLFANSTYYPIQDQIRYISFINGKFEIAEIEPDDFLWELLKICANPTPIHEIKELLLPLCSDEDELLEKVEALIGLQLLFSSLDANITGQDYFERIQLPAPPSGIQYIISERECVGGAFPKSILRHVEEMYHFLAEHACVNGNERLQTFVSRFRNKFENQEVPIMVALDPEIGIGYADMEESEGIDDLILKLASNRNKSQVSPSMIKDHFTQLLTLGNNAPIHLEKLALTSNAVKPAIFPNTFNFLFSEADGMVVLEHIGGVTATALAGRFTLASDDIKKMAKEMVKIEQQANSDIIFFDLAYTAEADVDNVNRRSHIYDYQLSLFNFDTSNNPITANDIKISVKGDQLILRSSSLNKRLVPRLASAYNHSRSDLPIFRLLCDLQDQGLACNFLVKPEQLFPGCRTYARIQFKNIILSPQKWHITEEHKLNLHEYLINNKVPNKIRVGVGDQTLYFDISAEKDLIVLKHFLKTKKELMIEETFISERCRIKDKDHNGFAAQYMAAFYHREKVYEPYSIPDVVHATTQRSFLPGQEWLYYEIFCHTSQMEALLCGEILQFINEHEDSLEKWFFIRYDEGGAHIRLRLKPYNPLDNHNLQSLLMSIFKPYHDQGIISDIRLCTYVRELERYGTDIMDEVEYHFARDSKTVLGLIKSGYSIQQCYVWSTTLFERILSMGIQGIGDNAYFAKTILQSLQNEHNLGPMDYKELNKKYKDFGVVVDSPIDKTALDNLARSFDVILNRAPEYRRNTLLIDLFHMHINRLFPSYQRTHEMVIYYFMERKAKANGSRIKELAIIT